MSGGVLHGRAYPHMFQNHHYPGLHKKKVTQQFRTNKRGSIKWWWGSRLQYFHKRVLNKRLEIWKAEREAAKQANIDLKEAKAAVNRQNVIDKWYDKFQEPVNTMRNNLLLGDCLTYEDWEADTCIGGTVEDREAEIAAYEAAVLAGDPNAEDL